MRRSITLLYSMVLMVGMSFVGNGQNPAKTGVSSETSSQGIKFYKHIKSGVSLQWFIEDSLSKKCEIKFYGKSDYCQAFTSSAYPGLVFTFSSKTQKPVFRRFEPIASKSDYQYMGQYLDLKGVLFEIEISLPKKIDRKKVFGKLCKDYPQIKPVFKKQDMNKPAGGCVLKTKGGRYIWNGSDIYVSFTFADYAGVTGSNPYVVNMLKQEGQNFGVRTIMIQDKKLRDKYVTAPKNKDKKAADKAQDAALDF